jgi:hypothetical protein
MTPKEFAEYIKNEVILDLANNHETILGMQPRDISDSTWKKIVEASNTMSQLQKEAMQLYAMQAMIDVATNILGILDGTCILSNHREDFALMYGENAEEINGNLQDYFLNLIQEQDT